MPRPYVKSGKFRKPYPKCEGFGKTLIDSYDDQTLCRVCARKELIPL